MMGIGDTAEPLGLISDERATQARHSAQFQRFSSGQTVCRFHLNPRQ